MSIRPRTADRRNKESGGGNWENLPCQLHVNQASKHMNKEVCSDKFIRFQGFHRNPSFARAL